MRISAIACGVLVVLVVCAGGARAQIAADEGTGAGVESAFPERAPARPRAQGRVTDPKGEPVAGAAVTLRAEGETGSALSTKTNKKGRWSIRGLRSGRWRLSIVAEGLMNADGWLTIPERGSVPEVDVEMRSLDEVSPIGWDGRGSTTTAWIELGNELLEEGRTAEARAEYLKALAVLPDAGKPAVLQAVARTFFLEQDMDGAVAALKSALALDGQNAELRRLFQTLMDEFGRTAEAETILADAASGRLAGEQRAAAQVPRSWPPQIARWIDAPAVRLAGDMRGRHKVTLEKSSPLGGLDLFWKRSGLEPLEFDRAERHRLKDETYQLFVPQSVPERGYGLLVWVSPTPFGGFTRQGMEEALERQGMIWIGADGSGNLRWLWHRWGLALDAAASVEAAFDIDPDRIYVSGYSGGGRVASSVATLYPEVFRGGFSWFGVNHYHQLPLPDKPGAHWPAHFPPPDRQALQDVKRQSRFVLLTGERDFNRTQTKAVLDHLRRDGFAHLTYIEIPGADHYYGIRAEWMERGLAALDEPLGP